MGDLGLGLVEHMDLGLRRLEEEDTIAISENGTSVGTNIGKYWTEHGSTVNNGVHIVIQSSYRSSSLHAQSNVGNVDFVSGRISNVKLRSSKHRQKCICTFFYYDRRRPSPSYIGSPCLARDSDKALRECSLADPSDRCN